MTYRQLVQTMMGVVPFEGEGGAPRALEASLVTLLPLLSPRTTRALLAALPDAPRALIDVSNVVGSAADPGLPALSAGMAALLDVSQSRALETLEIAWGLLGRALPPDLRGDIQRELPKETAQLFVPPTHHEAMPSGVGRGHSLADGRPGSARPLSESAAGSQHPVASDKPAAQGHSVAERNPHGESKLSSARGLTQEREHESLAEGHRRA